MFLCKSISIVCIVIFWRVGFYNIFYVIIISLSNITLCLISYSSKLFSLLSWCFTFDKGSHGFLISLFSVCVILSKDLRVPNVLKNGNVLLNSFLNGGLIYSTGLQLFWIWNLSRCFLFQYLEITPVSFSKDSHFYCDLLNFAYLMFDHYCKHHINAI